MQDMKQGLSIPEPSLAGFDDIKRYWDKENNRVAAKLLPGQYYVTTTDEMLTTVLGSCIAACIRDAATGVGGMNHFMLPMTSDQRLQSGNESVIGSAMRYGNFAMEHLINTILAHGGRRESLEVKLFGGGKIIAKLSDVGQRNIDFVLDYITVESLNLLSYDLGDIYPRKVNFFPKTGKVRMKKIRDLHNDTIIHREQAYQSSLNTEPVESDIDLF